MICRRNIKLLQSTENIETLSLENQCIQCRYVFNVHESVTVSISIDFNEFRWHYHQSPQNSFELKFVM